MSTLIVTLSTSLPTATTPCSTVLTEDGQTVKQQTEAPLSLWPDTTGGEIVAIVPAAQLSWHRLNLPKGTLERSFFQEGGHSRLRSVIDGLIEDRLLDEPELLHFSIEPRAQAGSPTWVAACNRAWLNAWLQALEQAGKAVTRIVPEMEPAATDSTVPSALHIVGTQDHAHVLWSHTAGVSVLPLSGVTAALVTSAANAQAPPKVVAEPAVAALAEQYFTGGVALQTAAQRALTAAASTWDLAQFDLLRSRRARTRKRLSSWGTSLMQAPQWKPARWAVIALVVINLGGLQAWAWKEQSALSAKRGAIREILTSTFPDVRVVVDAPLQMQRSLANLQRQNGAASGADMEEMLGRFQTAAPEIPAPTAIEFIAGELRLKLPTVEGIELAGVNARMQAYGYSVQMRGDNLVLKQERQP
jgi:general secretion pathway protein L